MKSVKIPPPLPTVTRMMNPADSFFYEDDERVKKSI